MRRAARLDNDRGRAYHYDDRFDPALPHHVARAGEGLEERIADLTQELAALMAVARADDEVQRAERARQKLLSAVATTSPQAVAAMADALGLDFDELEPLVGDL
ncbi:hypothetical protein [Haloactinopolyspora alba]|uniref:hypothetical protein n=1 Tax=Haloactinopolyspora alba TaxID=648780 RepID=UPI00101C3270|nr:hypothetical protein [Haloactinopolyspora alba]